MTEPQDLARLKGVADAVKRLKMLLAGTVLPERVAADVLALIEALSKSGEREAVLREAAAKVFAGLNARIDAAVAAGATAVPVFDGIAELSDALSPPSRRSGRVRKSDVFPGETRPSGGSSRAVAPRITEAALPVKQRERPSRHGVFLGEMLSALEQVGRKEAGVPLPDMCATCAFRPGCMTNQMAATGVEAMRILAGVDKDRFACHHGMKDGEPQKLCAGYIAASLAPHSFVTAGMEWLNERLAATAGQPDDVRAEFDAWIAEVDPEHTMDDYQRGRAYLRRLASADVETPTGHSTGGPT